MMTQETSAKIFAFPAGGRPRSVSVELPVGTAVVASLAAVRAARAERVEPEAEPEHVAASGNGSWYHEAAVREAELARKR
jgi:hypothetical protein